jgi:SAM-dependent methyltransferase
MICKICGNEKGNQEFKVREMMFGYKDVFLYFQCSQCKCLQLNDHSLNFARYYPDFYYSLPPGKNKNRLMKIIIGLRNNYALFNTGFLGKLVYARRPNLALRSLSHLALHQDSSILDVGCGAGKLLIFLSEMGFKNLLGVDPFIAQDIEYANGLKILKNEVWAVNGLWDIVMFHHSFEHISNPAKTLQTVSNLLAPNGHCIIRIPVSSSYAWEHYGVTWVQLDAPRHLFLHSTKSMQILAEQAKLDLYNVIYDSFAFQFWGSEQYMQGMPLHDTRSYLENPKSSIFSKKEICSFENRAKELNARAQGDQAVFYLMKP